jgi:DNA replication protein DnaC
MTEQIQDSKCSICEDTGYTVKVDRDGLRVATRCDCIAQRRAERLFGAAEIPKRFQHCSVDNFALPEQDEAARKRMSEIVFQVRCFVREFPVLNPSGFLLCGGHGVGKTHLSVSILRGLTERGHETLFVNYQRLLEKIREGFDKTLGAVNRNVYKQASEVEVLLLDDLGANRVSDWVEDTICGLINYRYDNDLATIVTTNFPMEPSTVHACLAERVGARAASRLHEMCTILYMPDVPDYRLRAQGNKGGGS